MMMHSNAPAFVPESVLRRDNNAWRREMLRRSLEQEHSASQLQDVEHCRIALSCLVQEACRHNDKVATSPLSPPTPLHVQQQRLHQWVALEDEVVNSADDYQSAIAKLSSMMLWEDARRRWCYAYHEDELYLRRVNQMKTLAALDMQAGNGGCRFFLAPPQSSSSSSLSSPPVPTLAAPAPCASQRAEQQHQQHVRPTTGFVNFASLADTDDEDADADVDNEQASGEQQHVARESHKQQPAPCSGDSPLAPSSAGSSPAVGPTSPLFTFHAANANGTSPLSLLHQHAASENTSFSASAGGDSVYADALGNSSGPGGARALDFSPMNTSNIEMTLQTVTTAGGAANQNLGR